MVSRLSSIRECFVPTLRAHTRNEHFPQFWFEVGETTLNEFTAKAFLPAPFRHGDFGNFVAEVAFASQNDFRAFVVDCFR